MITARRINHAENVRRLNAEAEHRMTTRGSKRCGGCGLWQTGPCRRCTLNGWSRNGQRRPVDLAAQNIRKLMRARRAVAQDARDVSFNPRAKRRGGVLETLGALVALRMFRGGKRGA